MDSEREMHDAVCSECGENCQVPFKPSGDKPVKCQECFRKSRPKRSFNNDSRGRSFDRGPREMHKAVCADCKQECEVPFKPSGDKPVRCKECFAKYRESQVGKFD